MELIRNEQILVEQRQECSLLTIPELIDRNILKSPDSSNCLTLALHNGLLALHDEINFYPLHNGCPLLYPKLITDYWTNDLTLKLQYYENPILQYNLLSQIKHSGEINSAQDSVPAMKHRFRFKEFCNDLDGIVLDVGCNNSSQSSQLFSEKIEYVGLDPFVGSSEFCLIGLGEVLPISDQCVDVVSFNTSLDHILDYHTAIIEAHRVLKNNGTIVVATYAWLDKATLLSNSVHFHHFREYQLMGALNEFFRIDKIKRYEDPKNSTHRYGLYISAVKEGA
jgi:SAM-dependent methyltransferase